MQLLSFYKLTKDLNDPFRCSVSHEAGSDCNSRDILQMLTQGPEKTNAKSRNASARKPPCSASWVLSLNQWDHHRVFTPIPSQKNYALAEPPEFLCQASGEGIWRSAGSCSGSRWACTLVVFSYLEFVFSHRSFWSTPTPLSFTCTRTHIDTHISTHILSLNLFKSSMLAWSQHQHWLGRSKLLSPKITKETWEHATHPGVLPTMMLGSLRTVTLTVLHSLESVYWNVGHQICLSDWKISQNVGDGVF